MGNTPEGAKMAVQTIYERYGPEFYRLIGLKGGKKGRTGGFASKKVGPDGLTGVERAKKYGPLGGPRSRRGPNNGE